MRGFIHGLPGFGKIHQEQGDGCGHDGGNGGDTRDFPVDILHNGIRFGPHIRGIGMVCAQGEEIEESGGSRQELLAGEAEFLSGPRFCGGLTIFFVFQ